MYLLTEDAQRDYRRERELMMDRPTPSPACMRAGGGGGRRGWIQLKGDLSA